MFQISADQTEWFHLYRVQKFFPMTFVLFSCQEINDRENTSRLLDLRILSNDQDIMGSSWRVKGDANHAKQVSRADCTKFLEVYAKFFIANTTKRGIDEIELVESSRDELAMAVLFDENLRSKFEAVAPTLFPKLARNMINELSVNQTGLEFEELPEWPARNVDSPG